MDPQPEDVRSNKTDQHRLTLDSWRERGGEKQTEGNTDMRSLMFVLVFVAACYSD